MSTKTITNRNSTMKISRKNWESSKEKWELILKNIRNRNKIYRERDICFFNVRVEGNCGYCAEFSPNCTGCPLDQKNLCGATFFLCLGALRASDYSTALKHAKKIYKAILDDEVNVYEEEG
jgi:predicted metalloprotease